MKVADRIKVHGRKVKIKKESLSIEVRDKDIINVYLTDTVSNLGIIGIIPKCDYKIVNGEILLSDNRWDNMTVVVFCNIKVVTERIWNY